MRTLLAAFAVVLISSASSFAQLSWTQTNGPYGVSNGQVLCIATSKVTWNLFYGTYGGGVWGSLDSGATWSQVNSGISDLNIHCIAGSVNQHVFAGTYTGGVFRSTDNGVHWAQVNTGLPDLDVWSLASDSKNILYAGTETGVSKSTDDGATWKLISGSTITDYAYAVAVNPQNDNLIFASSGDGIHRSTDAGATWTHPSSFYPSDVQSLSITYNGIIFAAVNNGGGVQRSTDNGATWQQCDSGMSNIEVLSVAANGNNEVIAGTRGYNNGGVFYSSDNGNTWHSTGISGVDVCAVFNSFGYWYAGTPSGVQQSYSNCQTWTNPGQIGTSIATLAAYGNGNVYAGASGLGLYATTSGGNSWSFNIGFGDSSVLTSMACGNTIAYLGCDGAGVQMTSNGGASWKQVGLDGYSIYSLVKGRDGAVYAGSYQAGVMRSANGISNWSASLASGLQNNFVYAMAMDSSGNIFAGTDRVGVYCTTNNGTNWNQASTGLSGAVSALAASPSGTVLAGTVNGIYRTTNVGASWTAVPGWPGGVVAGIAVDTKGNIFAATKTHGVYESTDNGITWSAMNTGLTTTSLLSIAIDDSNYLYAGSSSAGVFRTTTSTATQTSSAPSAPVLLTATPGNDTVTLIWLHNPESTIKTYLVYMQMDSQPIELVDTINDTTVVFGGLPNDTTDYFFIKAVNNNNQVSAASNVIAAIPTAAAPGQYGSDNQTDILFHVDPKNSDASGHGNNGVSHGATLVPGRFGSAWSFSNGAYVSVANAPVLNPTKQLTVECWFQVTAPSGDQPILILKGVPGTSAQYGITLQNAVVNGVITTAGQVVAAGRTYLQVNQWYHVAEVYDGSTLKIFLNGQEDGSISVSGDVVISNAPLYVSAAASSQNSLNAMIDEVRISNVARAPKDLNLYLPSAVTQVSTPDAEAQIRLHGVSNPHGLPTKIYFEWDTVATLANPAQTNTQDIGSGNADSAVYAVITVTSPHTYFYRLVAVTSVGTSTGDIQSHATVTGVHEIISAPVSAALEQNYPNPFSATTEFKINLPPMELSRASLKIFDNAGDEVANLTSPLHASTGKIIFNAGALPAGSYWYSLETPAGQAMRRMEIVR